MPTPRPHPPQRSPLARLLKAGLRQLRSLAVVGIGSDLRGDDIAGLLVLRELREAMTNSKAQIIHSDASEQVRPRSGATVFASDGRANPLGEPRFPNGSAGGFALPRIEIPIHRIHAEVS